MDRNPTYQRSAQSSQDPDIEDLDPDSSETNPVANDIDPDAEDLAPDNFPQRDPAADDWEASGSSPGENELGFDPESPDVSDPQVDPVGAAIVPGDIQDPDRKKDQSNDYDPLGDLRP